MKTSTFNRIVALTGILALVSAGVALAAKPLKEYFAGDTAGFFIGDCGTFNVLSDYTFEGQFKVWFDADGNPVRAVEHYNYDAIYYADTNPDEYVRGGPGEVENLQVEFVDGTFAVAGLPFKLTIPGYGVVFHDAGRVVFDLGTGDILFESGPSDFLDENLEAICAALTP
jgi:hypothetical protein